MHGGKPFLLEFPFQRLMNDARPYFDGQRLLIDFINSIHAFGIQDNSPKYWESAALRATSPSPGRHGYLVIIGNTQDFRHFVRIRRVNDKVSRRPRYIAPILAIMTHFWEPEVIN